MIAPKGPGHLVRRQFTEGRGVPGLVAVHQDATGEARDARARLREGHRLHARRRDRDDFRDETETDLFGEQAVLCGGVSELVQAGYETLVDAGYDPQAGVLRVPARAEADRRPDVREGHHRDAFLDLQHGRVRRPSRAASGSSPKTTRQAMRGGCSARSSQAKFAREWIAENRAGQENFKRMREGAGRPPDRARGQGTALDDGLDRDRSSERSCGTSRRRRAGCLHGAPRWGETRSPQFETTPPEPEPEAEPEAGSPAERRLTPVAAYDTTTRSSPPRPGGPHERPCHHVTSSRRPRPRGSLDCRRFRRRLDLLGCSCFDLRLGDRRAGPQAGREGHHHRRVDGTAHARGAGSSSASFCRRHDRI